MRAQRQCHLIGPDNVYIYIYIYINHPPPFTIGLMHDKFGLMQKASFSAIIFRNVPPNITPHLEDHPTLAIS